MSKRNTSKILIIVPLYGVRCQFIREKEIYQNGNRDQNDQTILSEYFSLVDENWRATPGRRRDF